MPDWNAEIRRRLNAASLSAAREASIVNELADHLQDTYEALRSRGVSEAEAVERALAGLRGHETIVPALGARARETPPAVEPGAPATRRVLGDACRDVRYGLRVLLRTPAFTAITVLTLAFGIGANTTVFTIISTLFLNPFPVASPSELVALRAHEPAASPSRDVTLALSHPNLMDVRARATAFSGMTGHSSPLALTYVNGQAPERIFGALVIGNYFDVLGLRPAAGRFFRPEEDAQPGTHAVLVLGYGAWQRRFSGDPQIVGRTLRINGVAFTVVGVAPPGFKGIEPIFGPDLWMPAMMAPQVVPAQMRDWLTNRAAPSFQAIARLARGVSAEQADANVRVIGNALAQEYPDANRGRTLDLSPLTRAALMGSGGQPVWTMMAALWAIPIFVLLIACSNVANLLLARAAARRQEMAVRLALGAGRGRLLRQLVTESLVLATASGVLGSALAVAGTRLLWSFRPAEFAQNLVDLSVDGRVFVFAAVVSLVTGLVFGLAPAVHASKPDIVTAVKEETRTAGRSRRGPSAPQVLLVAQVALSVVSLVMAGLCIRSIQRAYSIDPGFDTARLGIVMLSPGQVGYDRARSEQFYRDAEARLSALPGVQRVSWSTNLPLFSRPPRAFAVEGAEEARDEGARPTAIVNAVGLGYFDTTRIRLVRGRDFVERDRSDSVPVAIVNESLAAAYWPGRDAIGRRVRLSGETTFREVIGVAKTANYQALGEPPQPCIYLPLRQAFSDTVVLYVATASDPAPVMTTVQRELRALDAQVDASDVRTARTIVGQALFGATAGVGLLTTFGLVALALASLGLYGLMAYAVTLRQRELAVRMAIGASRGHVLGLVLRQGMTLVAAGALVGLALAMAAGRAVSGLLYGVSAADPLSLAGASLVLLVVAALACLVPAWRASRLNPLQALRG